MKLPHVIMYTDDVVAGDAKLFRIRINPKYKDDTGLHAHEYEHVVQWYIVTFVSILLLCSIALVHSLESLYFMPMTLIVYPVCYTTITAFRKGAEVRAFQEQLKHSPHDIDRFAKFLAGNYKLGITIAQAKRLLES